MNLFIRAYQGLKSEIGEINRKYAEPKIQMTPLVRLGLLFLRFYLFVLVGLLIYRFIIVVRQ